MGYEFITKYNSPNYGYPRGEQNQNRADKIIIHHWGVDGQNFYNVINNWLCVPRSETGAHFVAEAGRVACLIDYNNAAWGAGVKWVNLSSIQIECRPECSAGDFETVAELIADIWKNYGRKLPLKGHKDYVVTACPGRYYPRLNELYNRASAIYDGQPKPKGITVDGVAGPETVNAWQRFLSTPIDGIISGQEPSMKRYLSNISAINYNGGGSLMVAAWQRYLSNQGFSVYPDGYLGPLTIRAMQRYMNKWWGASLDIDGYCGGMTIWYLQRFLNYKLYGI